jgi:hypothetical protein
MSVIDSKSIIDSLQLHKFLVHLCLLQIFDKAEKKAITRTKNLASLKHPKFRDILRPVEPRNFWDNHTTSLNLATFGPSVRPEKFI